MRRFHLALLVLVLLATQSLLAATYYVGNCKVTKGYYTTIQDAVTSVPAGSTVEVCPGPYYEQVIISQPLTLEGIPNWNTGPVTISDAGVTLTTTTSITVGSVAPQVWVTAGPVKIINISVIQTTTTNPSEIGIFYASGSSGTVEGTALSGNTSYIGIVAENGTSAAQSVTVENSYFSGQISGIFINCSYDAPTSCLTATVKYNDISITGGGTALASYGNSSGSFSNNFVTFTTPGEGLGIWGGAYYVNISGNWIWAAGFIGIDVEQVGVNVTSNQIFAAGTGIYIYSGDTSAGTIRGNNITDSLGPAIEFNCNPVPTITGNIINTASVGLDKVPSGFTGSNAFYNVNTKTTGGCS
jgi:hypothetical protein